MKRVGPGLGLAIGLALGAWALEALLRGVGVPGVSAIFIAIVLGLVARAVVSTEHIVPGARFASGTVLKVGIVLLGLRFDLASLAVVGRVGLLAILAALAAAALVATVVVQWRILPPRLALLVATGTAICGNSAIAAAAPVLGAKDEEVSYASGVITVFGMALVVVLPVLGHAVGLTDLQFGVMAGAGVHDSAQAVATGFIFSDAAGDVATVVKLARTTALIPLLFLLSAFGPSGGTAGAARVRVPWFAVGFVALAAVRTLAEALSSSSGGVLDAVAPAATACILVAMAGLGMTTRFADLRRIGVRPLVVGLVASVAVTGAAGAVAVMLG